MKTVYKLKAYDISAWIMFTNHGIPYVKWSRYYSSRDFAKEAISHLNPTWKIDEDGHEYFRDEKNTKMAYGIEEIKLIK